MPPTLKKNTNEAKQYHLLKTANNFNWLSGAGGNTQHPNSGHITSLVWLIGGWHDG